METFELTNINRVAIPLKDWLPEKYAREYGIPGAVQKHAYYLTRNGSKITCRAKVVYIGLHFLLTGKALYNLKDLGWRGLDAGHHNIIALTDVKNETLFKITPVSTCNVHLTEDRVTQCTVC